MEGKKGKVAVWCEMSKIMDNDQPFVYLVCQDQRTGRIVTVEDHRSGLDLKLTDMYKKDEIKSAFQKGVEQANTMIYGQQPNPWETIDLL